MIMWMLLLLQAPLLLVIFLPLLHSTWSFTPIHKTSRKSSWSSSTSLFWTTAISHERDSTQAVQELLQKTTTAEKPVVVEKKQKGLVFLFVNQKHSNEFEKVVKVAWDVLKQNEQTQLLCLVGGGVVGGGKEVDSIESMPCMTMLSGVLPSSASVVGYCITDDEASLPKDSDDDIESHVLFVDPWAPTSKILQLLDGNNVIVGGISCPTDAGDSTVAWNGKCLPPGSAVGLKFSGSIGLQAICAQGCRPVGPVFQVTSVSNNVIHELDGVSALEQLEQIVAEASPEDKALIQSGGLLCGVSTGKQDFLARQIIGFQPKVATGGGGGSVVIATPVPEGSSFAFHVRDAAAAKEDMKVMVQRYKTERLFVGPQAGVPLAALQISCVARGQALYGQENVDLEQVTDLLHSGEEDSSTLPIAGFFANGEIGPVGLAGFKSSSDGGGTHVHGFTTVVALLCDYSSSSVESDAISESSTGKTSSSLDDATEAWG